MRVVFFGGGGPGGLGLGQIKTKNDVSNEGRVGSREFISYYIYSIIYTSVGPCLHHRQGRCSVSSKVGLRGGEWRSETPEGI